MGEVRITFANKNTLSLFTVSLSNLSKGVFVCAVASFPVTGALELWLAELGEVELLDAGMFPDVLTDRGTGHFGGSLVGEKERPVLLFPTTLGRFRFTDEVELTFGLKTHRVPAFSVDRKACLAPMRDPGFMIHDADRDFLLVFEHRAVLLI